MIKQNNDQIQKTETNNGYETILFYIARSVQLDSLLNELTRDFCSDKCDNGIRGCCNYNAYKFGVPEEMLILQEKEALRNRWEGKNKDLGCKYHSSNGCKLSLFKSPVCITFLCENLKRYLEKEHEIDGRVFTGLMGNT